MFLQTIADDEATGRVAEIYNAQKAQLGFVMATARCLTTRPDLLPIYTEFFEKVRAGFSLGVREWRLITLIAAKHIPSTYCSYVYGKQLIGDLGSKAAVIAFQRDFRNAGLSNKDVEMLAYAGKNHQGCLPGVPGRCRPVAIGWIHRSANLRYRALCIAPMLRQPIFRCHGRRSRALLHR